MSDRDLRERDILVGPNEYAYVQDLTKGNVILYVGPTKISLSNTERLIEYEHGRFAGLRRDEAGQGVSRFIDVCSSQYVILDNPTEDGTHLPTRGANTSVPLRHGRRVVLPGPTTFPLWPGQSAQVIEGHRLRQNEYLVVRRYDNEDSEEAIGTETIIRGLDTSFYVPPTGLEVIPVNGRFVRQAIRMDQSMGLHLRVVADFDAAEASQVPAGAYRAGQDLFISNRVGYFFPTEQLQVVGQVEPLPLKADEAVYVQDQASGEITLRSGLAAILLDPTKEHTLREGSPVSSRTIRCRTVRRFCRACCVRPPMYRGDGEIP